MRSYYFESTLRSNSFSDWAKLYLIGQGLDARDIVSQSFKSGCSLGEYRVDIDTDLAECIDFHIKHIDRKSLRNRVGSVVIK